MQYNIETHAIHMGKTLSNLSQNGLSTYFVVRDLSSLWYLGDVVC